MRSHGTFTEVVEASYPLEKYGRNNNKPRGHANEKAPLHGGKGGVKIYNWVIAFAAGVGGFLFGYEIGIINQIFAMEDFTVKFGIQHWVDGKLVDTPEAADIKGWITFSFLIACAVGAILVSYPADIFGRKRTIHIGSLFFVAGAVLQTASKNIEMLYSGRFVAGIGIGIMSAVVPLYISECAETAVRGRLISIYQLMITIGIFIASCVNSVILTYLTGELEWRISFGMQIVPSLFLFISVSALPFSPRWLLFRGREDEALKTLSKLRELPTDHSELIDEYNEISLSVEADRQAGNASWGELREPSILLRLFIGVTLQFFQQWTGINVILYYGSTLFEKMGFGKADSSIAFVLANNAINMLATVPGMWLIERAGRRRLFIWGGISMGLAHFMVTLFVHFSLHGDSRLAWGGIIAIFIFLISFAASWGPVVWVYQSEIFPLRVRAKGTSLSTVSNWVWNAVISKVTPIILDKIDYYTYVIFGGFCIVMAIFAIFAVPETKGKPLEEIDEIFKAKVGRKTREMI